ncbi:MAG TPA: PIN domain-containing protein [Propionibacteriaceae bacterium]
MSAERAVYLDSSAIVKLVVREPESAALRRYLRRKHPLLTSALARTEVARALLPAGPEAVSRGFDVLRRIDVVRLNDRILNAAGTPAVEDAGPAGAARALRAALPEQTSLSSGEQALLLEWLDRLAGTASA